MAIVDAANKLHRARTTSWRRSISTAGPDGLNHKVGRDYMDKRGR